MYIDSDQAMYCKYCAECYYGGRGGGGGRGSGGGGGSFVLGCSTFRLTSLLSHEQSDNHAKAVSSHTAKSKPQETPIERALLKMESGELENRRILRILHVTLPVKNCHSHSLKTCYNCKTKILAPTFKQITAVTNSVEHLYNILQKWSV